MTDRADNEPRRSPGRVRGPRGRYSEREAFAMAKGDRVARAATDPDRVASLAVRRALASPRQQTEAEADADVMAEALEQALASESLGVCLVCASGEPVDHRCQHQPGA